MRRGVMIVAVAGVIGASCVAEAQSGTAIGLPCGLAGAHTLAASHQARVYVADGIVYGCARGGRTPIRLGDRTSCMGTPLVDPVRVTGMLAAYGSETCGVDTGSTDVVVRRLTDGHRLRSEPATTGPLGVEGYQSVGSLVLKGDGAVAWIGAGHALGPPHRTTEVWRSDRHGTTRLDSGMGIRLRSLRLSGSTLHWRHGTRTRTAALS